MKSFAFFATSALALAVATPALAQNIVTNGGFETGTFSGWTQFGATNNTGVSGPFSTTLSDTTAPHSGSFQAYFGSVGARGGITQTLNTIVGRTYNISVWAANLSGGTPNFGSISFNGNVLGSLTNSPAFPYTNYLFSAVATSAQTELRFTFQHDPSFYLLDDVSVVAAPVAGAVPEPATWGMMILGFGVIGAGMRRRAKVSTNVRFA